MCGEGVTDMQTELTLSELAVQQAELLPERETLFFDFNCANVLRLERGVCSQRGDDPLERRTPTPTRRSSSRSTDGEPTVRAPAGPHERRRR
mgnify:CR=1 FL=1